MASVIRNSVKNILEEIYYGKDDMATAYQIKILIDHEQEINEYYNKKNYS